MLKKSDADITGTSLQGYVFTTYDELVAAFGEPSHNGDGYKTDAEWVLTDNTSRVVTIYNWKNGKNYCGDEGYSLEEITEWNIGGCNEDAVFLVEEALPNAAFTLGWQDENHL